jgi:hypothetical protein
VSLLLLLTATGTGGAYVVTFPVVTPTARFDGEPWTDVIVEESATRTGPWTEIASSSLTPRDTDPAVPAEREVTVTGATLAAGWYRLRFLDSDDSQDRAIIIYSGAGITPTLNDLARRMRTVTVDAGGQPGPFSATTTPTRQDAEGFIRSGLRRVRLKVGAVDAGLAEDAKEVVELYAAAQAELARWPEQPGTPNSPYDALMAEFTTALADLVEADTQLDPGGDDVTQTARPVGLWAGRGIYRNVRDWVL